MVNVRKKRFIVGFQTWPSQTLINILHLRFFFIYTIADKEALHFIYSRSHVLSPNHQHHTETAITSAIFA